MNDCKPCARCGKQNPAEIHTCTPRALVLVDRIEQMMAEGWATQSESDCADELRRLYAENYQLQRALRGAELGSRANFVSMQQQATLKTELLEAAKLALKTAESWIYDQYEGTDLLEPALQKLEPARAVITKVESEGGPF